MKKILLSILILASPLTALAAHHTYTCSDLTMSSIATCTGAYDINFFPGGSNQYAYNSGAMGFTPGTTYYVVANVSGSTGQWSLEMQQGSGVTTLTPFSTGMTGFTMVAGGGGDPNGIVIKPDVAGGTSVSSGTLSAFCISDVSLADCGYTPPTPPASTTPFATSSPQFDTMAIAAIVMWTWIFAFVVWLVSKFTL